MSKVLGGLVMALVAACGLLVTSTANARSVNVDFNAPGGPSGTYVGHGAFTSDNGTKWNGVDITSLGAFTSGALVDSGNIATTVTVSFTDTHSYYDNPTAAFAPALLDDYAVANGGATARNFTINGLVNGGVYSLYLYSENGVGYSQPTTFTITGYGSLNATNSIAGASGFVSGVNYVLYTGVVATGGSISGSWKATSGDNGAFNGFQLVIPEPASMSLLASGGLLLLRRRKRRAA